MDTIVRKTEFKFEELDERAKQRAIEHYRGEGYDDFDYAASYIIGDAVLVFAKLGIEIDTRNENAGRTLKKDGKFVRDEKGEFVPAPPRYVPDVDWSIESGGGFRFPGYWRARDMDVAPVLEDRPTDEVLRTVSAQLMAVVLRYPDLVVQIKAENRSVSVGVELYSGYDDNGTDDDAERNDALEAEIKAILNDAGDWVRDRLRDEYDYVGSDEYITERLENDDWQLYDEDGGLV